jgi:hypothetical protein
VYALVVSAPLNHHLNSVYRKPDCFAYISMKFVVHYLIEIR